MEPAQLVGREVADLIKPAYRALFRKTVAKRLAGEAVPRRIEMQLINGNQAGLWVEAQSSNIDYHGNRAILTIAANGRRSTRSSRYRKASLRPTTMAASIT